jgi:streptogramin lyase
MPSVIKEDRQMKLLLRIYKSCSTQNIVWVVFYLLIGMFLVTTVVFDQVYGADTPNFVAKWGYTGSGNGQFNMPWNVAFDSRADVYIVEQRNSRIQKFDAHGDFITKWGAYGSADGQFVNPVGIAIDSLDDIYVVDRYNHRIQKFDAHGNFITTWGSNGSADGQFNHPFGIAADNDGNIFVSEKNNNRIQKFDMDGNFITKWGFGGNGEGHFFSPSGITVNKHGDLYVVDTFNYRIQKFDTSGNFLMMWGSYGYNDGQFNYPAGIAIDGMGDIYITDILQNNIQIFSEFVEPEYLQVDIDIKPDDLENTINIRSKGVIPVAILTTEDFDATNVDPLSVAFGPDGAEEAHGKGHIEDVDEDGDLDLVLHFRTQETGIVCDDVEAILTEETLNGLVIEGFDSINIVKCN